jgi:ribosomal-protein-serine acetyltransferase
VRVPQAGEATVVNAALRESAAELGRWLRWATPVQTVEETEVRNRRAYAEYLAREYFHFHLYRRADGAFVGGLSLEPTDWAVPSFEIGYWVRTSLSGHGYITEAVTGLVDFAQKHFGAQRLTIWCDARNQRSAAVAERCGFPLVARMARHHRNHHGELIDSLMYAWQSDAPDPSRPPTPRARIPLHPILLDLPEPLASERLIMRPRQPGDGPAITAAVHASAASLRPWMPWYHDGQTAAESELHARQSRVQYLRREDLGYVLIERASGQLIGAASIFNFNWRIPSCEIGYWLHLDYQGRGYMTEAVNCLTALAFETLHMERIEIRCHGDNQRSAAVAQRCGYQLEARLHHHRRGVDGQLADTLVFARLRGDG